MASESTHEPALEPSVFSRLSASLPAESAFAVAAEVTRIFMEDSRDRVSSARAALHTYDLPTVGRAAHSLRTSAAMIGAARLSTLATRLETLVGSGERRGAGRLVGELDRECGRIAIALTRLSEVAASKTDAASRQVA